MDASYDGLRKRVISLEKELKMHRNEKDEDTIRGVRNNICDKIGIDFSKALLKELQKHLHADMAFVGYQTGLNSSRIRTIVCLQDGSFIKNFEYNLSGTPCYEVLKSNRISYFKEIRVNFPSDKSLIKRGYNEYIAIPLVNSKGKPIGILTTIFREKIKNAEYHKKLLKAIANRTSTELDRYLLMEDVLEKQEQLERISTMSSDYVYKGIFDKNNKIKISWVSGAFTEITGYTLNEFNKLKEKWTDLINPTDLKYMSGQYKNLPAEKQRIQLNYSIITKDGQVKWCSDQVSPLIDEVTEKIYGIWGSVKDITREKNTRYALEDSEDNFRNFYQNIPEIAIVYDYKGKIIYANRHACQTLEYPIEELISKSISDIYFEEKDCLLPEDLDKTFQNGSLSSVQVLVSKNGSHLTTDCSMTRGKWNGENVIYGIYKDITQLTLSEEKFSKVFHNNSTSMALVDTNTLEIADINESLRNILGFADKSEIIGRDPVSLGIVRDKNQIVKDIEELNQKGRSSLKEVTFYDKQGGVHLMLRSADMIEFQNKNFVLVSYVDITERKRIENELKASQNLISNIHKAIGVQTGEEYFKEAINILTRTVGCEYALIGRLSENQKKIITVVLSKKGKIRKNIKYDLSGTPSKDVIKGESVLIRDYVSENYPNDSNKALKGITIKGYAGTPLISSDGKIIGIIAALFPKPIENTDLVQQIFEIFSGRTSAELERHISYQALRESEEKFRTYVESSPLGIAITNKDSRIEYINPVLCRELGYELSDVVDQPISKITVLRRKNSKSNFIPRLNKYGLVLNEEDVLRRKNGDQVTMSYDGIKIPGNKYLSYMRDITQQKNTEAQIRKLLTAVEQSSSSVVITNEKGNIEYVNNYFLKVTGYQFHEVIGRNPRVLKTEYHDKSFYKNLWKTISSGGTWSGEFLNRKKNGKLFWERANITPVKDRNNKIINYIAIKEDITELKHQQEELQTIFDHTPLGIYLVDHTYIVKKENESSDDSGKSSTTEIFKFQKGKKIQCLNSKPKKQICSPGKKCSHCQIRDLIRDVFNDQKSRKDIILNFPAVTNKTKTENYFSVSVIPIRRHEEKQALVLISDISSRVSAENKLRHSEEKFRQAFKSSPDAIALNHYDDLRFIEVNDGFCKLTGYSESEIVGKTPYELGLNIDRDQAIYLTEKIRKQKDVIDEPAQFRVKSGKIIETLFSARTFKINNQIYVLSNTRDITEIKNINQALKESEERYKTLVDAFPDLIVVQNMKGKVLYTNPALENKEGMTRDELGTSMIHPDDKDYVMDKIHGLTKSDKQNTGIIENRIIRNGKVFWRSGVMCKIVYEGEPSLLTVSRDITDRKHAEQELIREKQFVDNMINTLPAIFYLFEVSDSLKLVRWNKQLEEMLEVNPDKLFYKSPFEFLDPYGKEEIDEAMEKLKKNETIGFEAFIHTATNQRIPYFLTTKMFTVGDRKYLLGIGIDISEQKKAENALKESEYNLRRAQEIAHVGSWSIDYSTNKMTWSKELQRIHELDEETFPDLMEAGKLVHPDDRDYVKKHRDNALKEKDFKFDVEYRLKCNNKIKWVREVADVSFNEKGKPVSAAGLTYDITERKYAEIKMKENQIFQQKIFNNLPVGMIVFNKEKIPIQINKALKEIFGYESQQIDLRTREKISNKILQNTGMDKIVHKVFKGRSVSNIETKNNGKGESEKIKWISITAFPVFDSSKVVNAVVVLIQDITARKVAEAMLRRSEEQFSKAFDLSPDMILLIQEGTNFITEINKGFLESMGLNKAEVMGKSIFDVMQGENLSRWEEFSKVYSSTSGYTAGETSLIDKNNEKLICEFTATRLNIHEKDHVMVVIRDVTDKRKVQELMRASQQKVIELNKKMADYKMMALRSVMNPHFIFNSLTSIQFYIAKNERKLAIEYLSLFSKLIRNILNSSMSMHITLEKELEILTYYIELEKLRFENIFEYTIIVDDNIEQEYIQIPSMILQPFVENAILHGLINKNSPGLLKIEIFEKENGILCAIEDNGIGREAAMKLKDMKTNKHKSVGVSVTSERLGIINQTDNVTVNFEDLKNENGNAAGTKVEVYIDC